MNKRMLHKRLVSLLCTTTVLLSTHALASQGDASQGHASESNSSQDHSNQIEQRQHTFTQVETLVEKANDTLDGDDTHWQTLEDTSFELTTHSQALLTSFPLGSQEGE